MGKKNKDEVKTELRALLPEEVEERKLKLPALITERKTIKRRAKESARDWKQKLESIDEEIETLSDEILRQQEEVSLGRQMTIAEIEDRARHELSIKQFEEESGKSEGREEVISADSKLHDKS